MEPSPTVSRFTLLRRRVFQLPGRFGRGICLPLGHAPVYRLYPPNGIPNVLRTGPRKQHLLCLEPGTGGGVEELIPEGLHGGVALKTLAVRWRGSVFENTVCCHSRHHPVNVVPVERVLRPLGSFSTRVLRSITSGIGPCSAP